MSYALVIVNWNGAADTVACLASVATACRPSCVIVIDNGSGDDSVPRIGATLQSNGRKVHSAQGATANTVLQQLSTAALREPGAVLVQTGENLGFAGGANLGLAVAQAGGWPLAVFLNNDTIVHGNALDRIVQRLASDDKLFACLPLLTVHGSDRIWNAGGEIYRIGLRRYHHAGRSLADVRLPDELPCSFFTGCCFAVRTGDFVQRGGFTERFFFGEEDFELGLWMRSHKLHALCLTRATVAHKVSASFSAAAGPREDAKVFIYYLNRFIHMRLRLGAVRWALWLALVLPYTAVLLWQRPGWSAARVTGLLWRVLQRARHMDGVTRSDFEAVMAGQL